MGPDGSSRPPARTQGRAQARHPRRRVGAVDPVADHPRRRDTALSALVIIAVASAGFVANVTSGENQASAHSSESVVHDFGAFRARSMNACPGDVA